MEEGGGHNVSFPAEKILTMDDFWERESQFYLRVQPRPGR